MLRPNTSWRFVAMLALVLAAQAPAAGAAEDPHKDSTAAASDSAAPAALATPTATAPVEEQLRQQAATLQQLQELLLKQQAEIERLRGELDAVRATSPAAPTAAGAAAAGAAAPASASAAPAAAPEDDALAKKVDSLDKAWGNLKLTGDVRFRYEGFSNQGFDAPTDVAARNRLRLRVRAQLTSKIDNHFDFGIRLASGSLDDPTSTNTTLDNFYDRKAVAIDRAFLHYATDTKPGNLDIYVGKFDYTWKRTSLTFDSDVQPEGLSERLSFKVSEKAPLRGITLTAWQLPFKERSIGADAFDFGGQVLSAWTWSKNFSSTASVAYHDFEQANVIPPLTGVSPTLVNAGLEIGTTNTVVVNAFTGLPEYRSRFHDLDAIADVTYTGFSNKYPLTILAEYLHNFEAFNKQDTGGEASLTLGRAKEEGDVLLGYTFWKAEREVFPSVFMESDVTIQTNSVAHWFTASYMLRNHVQMQGTYFFTRRLQTTSFENRWLNRYQLDMIYSF